MIVLLAILAGAWISAEMRCRDERRASYGWERIAKAWQEAAEIEAARADEIVEALMDETDTNHDDHATN